MTTATSSFSSDDGWFSSIVFRLACAFWFFVGAAFGRATSGWFGGGGDRKRVRDASTSTTTATATVPKRMNGERINDAEESSETTPARRLSGESTRADATETSVRSRRKSVGEGSRTTTMRDVEAMEVNSASAAGDKGKSGKFESGLVEDAEDEAQSSFVQVDDEMEDAFEEETATSSTPLGGFGTAPSAFDERTPTKEEGIGRQPSTVDESPVSTEEEEDDSDSAETKEKLQFVNENVSEAAKALENAEDERARARAEANKIEWERRAEELAKQREEARRLKAAARKERRMRERSDSHRQEAEDRAKAAESLNQYRVSAQDELKNDGLYHVAERGDLAGLLIRLGTHENGKNIETSYKKALLKFHPDRSAARGGSLEDQARCEETFKLLQACRKVWENMGKPQASFTKTQPTPTRSWTRSGSSSQASPPNQSTHTAYHAYTAGRKAADAERREKQAAENAAFVAKAKRDAVEAEGRMREEAARRWRELQRMQRTKVQQEAKAETHRVDSLKKAREREELRQKLEEIKRTSGSFVMSSGEAFSTKDGKEESPKRESPQFTRTVSSGTRVHINVKPVTSPAADVDAHDAAAKLRPTRRAQASPSGSPRSPQSKEETLHRL